MNAFEKYAFPILETLPELTLQERNQTPADELIHNLEALGQDVAGAYLSEDRSPYRRYLSGEDDPTDEVLEERLDRVQKYREIIEEGVSVYGMRFLAFYKSIHFRDEPPFRGQWGIFLFDWAVDYLHSEIATFYPNKFSPQSASDRAWNLLFNHEFFHFRIDAWTLPYEELLRKRLYELYHSWVYRRLHPGPGCVEESLANKFAFDHRYGREIAGYLTRFMKSQPAAYAAFDDDPDPLRATLAAQILQNSSWAPNQALVSQSPWIGYGRNRLLNEANCPTYRILNSSPTALATWALSPPELDEIESFVTSYLGGQPAGRTDHAKYRIDNGEMIKIPNTHGNVDRLKTNEFKGILLKSGMRRREFEEERIRTGRWRRGVPREVPKPALAGDLSGAV